MPTPEMRAVASFGDDPEKIVVVLPPGDPQAMLAEVATKPEFHLFGAALSYSYPDEELGNRPVQPANTLIEMGVPYCFHVPDKSIFQLKQEGAVNYLVFTKVWTTRAAGSSNADYRSPTHVLYHNKTTVTPRFPTAPDLGPEPICAGVNLEAEKDRSGLYRYSLVRMYLDTDYTRETLISKLGAESARSDMIARGVAAINRFVDVYRAVTRAAHIQRLARVHVRDIFFREHNIGYHGASFGHGIGTAVMNRSETELKAISRMSASGEDIATWELLFLDADASLDSNSFALAVVNAFQALELHIEDFLRRQMAHNGMRPTDIDERLDRNWRTKERLKELVPSFVGRRLIDENPKLWDRFCWAYDDIRNKLIHAARDLDRDNAERAVYACRDVGAWLNTIVC
jgi:hypothetical protein